MLVKPFRSQWKRSVAGAAFTEKVNVEFEDEEFAAVDVKWQVSEPNEQSNDHNLSSQVPSRASSRVIVRK